jgi:hypothetical protein
MKPFPFTEADWSKVRETGWAIVNATLVNDDVLRESAFLDLQDLLADLSARYGEHPILLETEADFADDETERFRLYERAITLALANGLPTLSIRIALSKLFLEDLGQIASAERELLACESELATHGDDYDRLEWMELTARCRENQGV